MFLQKWFIVFVLLFFAKVAFTQQMVLGKNPYAMNKSAVLELNADNQGLLLPRITDTAAINVLNPPDGMVIYFVPTRRLLLRTSGHWSTLAPASSSIGVATGTSGTDVNVSGSPVTLGGTVTINLPSASASARGLLTSTDWNTFNNKQSALTFGNLTSSTSGVTVTGGAGAVIGSGTALNIQNATSSQNGLLTSVDWNTFNNKVSTTRTISTTAPLSGGGDLSADRTISMTQANATTNGWLSSTDWNTFNNKQAAGNYLTQLTGDVTATGPGSATATITNNAVTNAKFRQGIARSVVGVAGNATANVADIQGTTDQVLRIAPDGLSLGFGTVATEGITNGAVTYQKIQNVSATSRLLGRATAGAGMVEEITIGSGLGLSGTTLSVTGSFWSTTGNSGHKGENNFLGTTDGQPIFFKTGGITRMIIQGAGGATAGFVGIGTATPAEMLDVSGNLRFSGALMPGGSAGTSGQILRSNGAGTAPTWITPTSGTVSSVGLSLPSIFTVSNSPVTSSGTLTAAFNTQNANLVFASPSSGTAAAPSFRSLVKADLPATVVHTDQANTYAAGMKQTFRGNSTTAGLSFGGALTADPSTLVAGDVWYRNDGRIRYHNGTAAQSLVTEELVQTLTNKTISGASNTITNIGNASLTNSTIGMVLGTSGTDANVSGSPAALGGSMTLNLPTASATSRGLLSAADWSTFNSKGGGSVTSVGLSLPSIFTVSNSPVTSSGTLTAAFNTQNANLVFASPASGTAAAPSFRSLVKADLPATVVHTDQANTYTAGMKQTFRGNSTTAGLSFGGALTADPSTLVSGDMWYRSDLGKLKFYNGTIAKVIATEDAIAGTENYIPRFTPDGNTLGNSQVYDNGTNVGVNTTSPNSTLSINGSLTVSYKIISNDYTVLSTDYAIIHTGGVSTWTLPIASSCAGRVYRLINQGTGTVTLSQTVRIDTNTTTTTLNNTAGSNIFEILSDGSEWRQIK